MNNPNQNQFRESNLNAAPPQLSGNQPNHMMQRGLTGTPLNLQRQFFFSYKSEVDGETYEGQFTVKKLSVKDIAQIGVRKSQLNGGYYFDKKNPGTGVPEESDLINEMISYLDIAILQAPIWFDLNNIYDAGLLGSLYGKAAENENNFFRSRGRVAADPRSSQNDSSGTGTQSGTSGHVEAVGGGEVPTALEP